MKRLFVILLLVALMGCARVKMVAEAEYNTPVNFITVCQSPHELTQDCSFFVPTRATKTVRIGGFEIKIAGSKRGDVIFVTDAKFIKNRIKDGLKVNINSPTHCKASNDSFYIVQNALEEEGVKIKKVYPVKSFWNIDGYLIEVEGNGYSYLWKYIVRDGEEEIK